MPKRRKSSTALRTRNRVRQPAHQYCSPAKNAGNPPVMSSGSLTESIQLSRSGIANAVSDSLVSGFGVNSSPHRHRRKVTRPPPPRRCTYVDKVTVCLAKHVRHSDLPRWSKVNSSEATTCPHASHARRSTDDRVPQWQYRFQGCPPTVHARTSDPTPPENRPASTADPPLSISVRPTLSVSPAEHKTADCR